jgi:hypothetical protein
MRRLTFHTLLVLSLAPSGVFAQAENANLNVFGYFQVALGFQKDVQTEREQNSFTLQQFNLFLQKNLTQNWTAFVNFEFVNSYSSFFDWGAFSLEEAWINYRRSDQFKLKLGLLTPAFNNLNELKNRTPLLPYVIRPVVYESSFREIVATDDFVPSQAFAQAYGIIPAGETKFDYAIYLGNSPNINNDPSRGVTGLDTSRSFLLGGRAGVRHSFFKVGFSTTFDKRDGSFLADSLLYPAAKLSSVFRNRIGADLSYHSEKWLLAGEFIRVTYDFDDPEVNFNQIFYYATLGYYFSERLFAYASYWNAHANRLPLSEEGFQIPTFGVTYHLNDMIVLKAQSARVKVESISPTTETDFDYSYFAVSVVF